MDNINENYIAQLKKGDVILVSTRRFEWKSLPIKVANFFKRGIPNQVWCHAAIYSGEDKVIEAFPSGVEERSFSQSYLANSNFALLVLRHKGISDDKIDQWVLNCRKEVGKKYDMKALIYFPLLIITPEVLRYILDSAYVEKLFNVSDAFFCSELVSSALLTTNEYTFSEKPSRVMPVDFYNELTYSKVLEINAKPKQKHPTLADAGALILYSVCTVIALIISALVIFGILAILFGPLISLSRKLRKQSSAVQDTAKSKATASQDGAP